MPIPPGSLAVVAVLMRRYRAAVVAVDAPLQATLAALLTTLKSDWLSTDYAVWAAAGYPTIE